MALPWQILQTVETRDGTLELRQRGEKDFLITLGGLILMNSAAHRSELALGALACRKLRRRKGARVLVGGLGMAFTLRAVLDSLPEDGRAVVAELNPVVVEWCRGPLAALTGSAVDDPRVEVVLGDVNDVIRGVCSGGKRFHAIVLDLYQGPGGRAGGRNDPLYGMAAIHLAREALEPGGVLAVWGENHDPAFEKRLKSAGFSVERERPGHGGLRHVVYLATPEAPRGAKPPRAAGPKQLRRPAR